MRLTFRLIAIGVVVVGIGFGAAFGAGVAVGRGDQPTTQTSLNTQQLQSMLGITSAGAASTSAGAAALASRGATGKITSVQGSTVTIETRTGPQKVNLAPSTTFSKLTQSPASELREGLSIVASGTRKDDGSFDATSITEVPAELAALLTGGVAGTGR